MSITVSDIIVGAYRRLGRPSQTDMPYIDLIDITRDVWRGLKLDTMLAARSHETTVGSWVTPSGKEMGSTGFTGGGEVLPVRVEWRPAGADDAYIPNKVEVVAYEQINDLALKSADAFVAFYDGMTNVIFSDDADTLSTREYRFIYESLADVDVDATTDTVTMPDIFASYLADEVALRALDYVDNASPEWGEKRERLRPVLLLTCQENKKRFDKWRTSLYGNKKVAKRGSLMRNRGGWYI